MQVNNSTSPNFGRLIIKNTPQVKNSLKQQTPELLETMIRCGEKLKNDKFFHVVTTENGGLGLRSSANAAFNPYVSEAFKKIYHGTDENILLFDDLYGVHQLNKTDADNLVLYNAWGAFGQVLDSFSDIDSLAKLAHDLDGAAVVAYNEAVKAEEAKKLYQQEVDAKTDILMNRFGDEYDYDE